MGNQVLAGAQLCRGGQGRLGRRRRRPKGGVWDWTIKGSLVCKEIDQALFSLPVGQLSPIIKSPNGYHIVRVTAREDAKVTPFLDAQVDIREKIVKQRSEKQLREYLAKLEARTPVSTIFDGQGSESGMDAFDRVRIRSSPGTAPLSSSHAGCPARRQPLPRGGRSAIIPPMPQLGVNIDHVATVRQARRTNEPDPVWAAALAELGGADGITLHLREDRRHISDRDLRILRQTVTVKLNLEMACEPEILEIACDVKPDQATLVPEKREEITTEGGLDICGNRDRVARTVDRLRQAGISVSLFLDPDPRQIEEAARLAVDAVELHTGQYALAAPGAAQEKELDNIRRRRRPGPPGRPDAARRPRPDLPQRAARSPRSKECTS